jgi:parvulin-like peptidyl-prolyl isomerase
MKIWGMLAFLLFCLASGRITAGEDNSNLVILEDIPGLTEEGRKKPPVRQKQPEEKQPELESVPARVAIEGKKPPVSDDQEIVSLPEISDLGEGTVSQEKKQESKTETGEALPVPADFPQAAPRPMPRVEVKKTVSDERALAVLGDREITRAELYDILMDGFGRQVFDRMLNRLLLEEELSRQGLSITPAELTAAFDAKTANLRQNGTENIDAIIRRQFNMTGQEYQHRVLWVELAMKKLTLRSLNLTDADVLNYYWSNSVKYTRPEEVRLFHIFINPLAYANALDKQRLVAGMEEWEKAHAAALSIREKLGEGADFRELAKKYSHDKKSAPNGGDLGFVPKGTLSPQPLADAAFSLKPKDISEIIKTLYGYHLLLVTEKSPEQLLRFSDIKDKVRNDYEEYMVAAQVSELLNRLRQEAFASGRLKILAPELQPQQ